MAVYIVAGHPLNYADLAPTPGAPVNPALDTALRNKGVGATVTLTLAAPDETVAEDQGCLE